MSLETYRYSKIEEIFAQFCESHYFVACSVSETVSVNSCFVCFFAFFQKPIVPFCPEIEGKPTKNGVQDGCGQNDKQAGS
jgi:hypothetical protein